MITFDISTNMKTTVKIVADNKIPFLEGVFESHGIDVVYIDGAAITADDVRDADALVVRTRTRCFSSLLGDSRVRIVATATIGFDHIDVGWCVSQGIEVATAAGCNARGVAQYVFACLRALDLVPGDDHTIGVVGVGNVGNVVARVARSMGFGVVCCDPPLVARGGVDLSADRSARYDSMQEEGFEFVSLEQVAEMADIITFHVPLDDSTRGMVGQRFVSSLKNGTTIINSSRGEVVDTTALLAGVESGAVGHLVLDVWPQEPDIDPRLLSVADIGTPHIAGYSLQGKAMGSAMAVRAVASCLGIAELMDWYPQQVVPTVVQDQMRWEDMVYRLDRDCDIVGDSQALKDDPTAFERLRSSYSYRQESF